jgi:NADH-quinone oxidoreductase subunit N
MNIDAYSVARQTFAILLPEILLLLVATVVMTAGAFVRWPRRAWYVLSVAAVGLALMVLLAQGTLRTDSYSSPVLGDVFAYYARVLLLFTGLIVLALAHDQVDDRRAAEFFGCLLFINAGAMVVATANELVLLFVGLELVSIPTYLLLYLSKRTTTTQEAATKYFYLSIFSSGLLLFGLAYLYGVAGVSNLKALAYLAGHVPGLPQQSLAVIAVVFVVAGLGFRVAAVPFHFYAPDVYQGSPTVIAGLLSWVPKAVGYLAMIRTLSAIVSAVDPGSQLVHRAVLLAWIIAAITMTLGNTVALAQNNLKRLLAYSSIAHAGYLMIGVAVSFRNTPETRFYFGIEGVLFYLTAYAFMTLGVFGAIVLLSTPERPVETVDDLSGLGQTHPVTALGLTICLLSLAGIPPLAGFWGKFELLASSFGGMSGPDGDLYWWLAVIGVLNSAVGAYYYLRIVVGMYLRDPSADAIQARFAGPTATAVAACVVLTFVLGIPPFMSPLVRMTHEAALSAVERAEPIAATPRVATVAPAER